MFLSLIFEMNSNVNIFFCGMSIVLSFLKILVLILSKGYCSNLDQFISKLPEEDKFVPMGEMIHSFTDTEKTYQVYKECSILNTV